AAFGSRGCRGLKGPGPILEELSLPLIKHAGIDTACFAHVGHRLAFQQVQAKNFDFVLGTEVPSFWLADTVPFYANREQAQPPNRRFRLKHPTIWPLEDVWQFSHQ